MREIEKCKRMMKLWIGVKRRVARRRNRETQAFINPEERKI